MIGKDNSAQSLGVTPCAISWLFKLIEERKEKAGARFSVRVSAVEISGRDEVLTDLLAEFSTGTLQDVQGAGVYLKEDTITGSQVPGVGLVGVFSRFICVKKGFFSPLLKSQPCTRHLFERNIHFNLKNIL